MKGRTGAKMHVEIANVCYTVVSRITLILPCGRISLWFVVSGSRGVVAEGSRNTYGGVGGTH